MVNRDRFRGLFPQDNLLPTSGRRMTGGPTAADLFDPRRNLDPIERMRPNQTGSAGPNAFQQILQRIRAEQQPNLLQSVGRQLSGQATPTVQPTPTAQTTGPQAPGWLRGLDPRVAGAIDVALQMRKGMTGNQNSPAPQSGAAPLPALPAINEFARRAQVAKAKGMTPADQRFSGLSDEQLKVLAQPAGKTATPQISESGQRLGLETGQEFDDSWLNEISTEYALQAWNDPQTAARIVLQANGLREDSAFGEYWLDLANTLPDLYRQQAASEPGTVATDGSDYLAFSQGVFENLTSPAGSEEAQSTLQEMNDFGAEQLNAIFNDPTSEISQRVQAAYDEATQYGQEADTLYQMAIAPAIRNYSSIDKQVIGSMYQKHFEQYQVASATGYGGSFLDYLRDDTDFLNQIT